MDTLAQVEPDENDLGPNFDHRIGSIIARSKLSPMARLCVFGAVNVLDAKDMEAGIVLDARGGGGTGKSPLEFYAFQSRDPLEEWEYLAGLRFREDFDLAHGGSGTLNLERMSLYATEATRMQHAQGYVGRSAARVSQAGDLSVARIDAMGRRGDLAKQCHVSFWLAEHIIGYDFWPKEVAQYLGVDVRYIGPRFREALQRIAGFYSVVFTSKSRAPMRAVRTWEHPG